jgi:hypothetical protein
LEEFAMRQKIQTIVMVTGVAVALLMPGLVSAQVPLDEQLKAQYNMVKMGEDSNGAAVIDAGTILNIKKGGILSVPYGDQPVATKYQDGTVHAPNALGMKARGFGLSKFGKQQTTQFFQVGTKVYPSKIQVNAEKDQVVMTIVACDSCNNTSPTTFYKADIVFQFAKGGLAKMSAPQVEDAIGGLLAVDEGGDQGGGQQGDNGNGNGNDQGNNQGGGGQAQQAPPPEPAQIEKGQTPDQVKAAIGVPDKIISLGAKQIYVYKDIKVTFINGKVSDVQ